jgi:hypothetical protein
MLRKFGLIFALGFRQDAIVLSGFLRWPSKVGLGVIPTGENNWIGILAGPEAVLVQKARMILYPAAAFAQDAKTFGETACPQFLSITRKAIAGRRTHRAVIPAKAGIHAKKNAVIA